MGSIWLTDLPAKLSGVPNVSVYNGWQTRSRSSGGYDNLLGVAVHHTASNTSPESDMYYQWVTCPDGPVGAIYLGRDGRIVIGAAGATNCVGKGGPWDLSRGTVPLNQGNQNTISIEAANTGVGEPWPQVQQDQYVALVRALCSGYGFAPSDVISHYEWCLPSCPGRKIDPAGPSRWGSINSAGTWNMDLFRAELGSAPTPPTPDEEDDVKPILTRAADQSIWVVAADLSSRTAVSQEQHDSLKASGQYVVVAFQQGDLDRVPVSS